MLVGSGLEVASARVAGRFHSISGWAVGRSCLSAVNAFEDQRPWNIRVCVWGMLLKIWGRMCICSSWAYAYALGMLLVGLVS